MEGLHILPRRLASPARWVDICHQFCLTPQSMSVIFNHLLGLMHEKWGDYIRLAWLALTHIILNCLEHWTMYCWMLNCKYDQSYYVMLT